MDLQFFLPLELSRSIKQWPSTEPGWSQTHDGRSRMDENPPLARDGEREWDADLDCRVNWERSRTVQKSGGVVDHHMDENAPLALDGEREWDADLDCRVNWERSPQPHPDGVEELSIITWMKMHHSRGTASAGGMQLSTALYSFGQRKRAGIEYHMDEVHHLRRTVSAGGWMYGLLLPALATGRGRAAGRCLWTGKTLDYLMDGMEWPVRWDSLWILAACASLGRPRAPFRECGRASGSPSNISPLASMGDVASCVPSIGSI
ncbi:hypothetical protein C8R43DRAFT_1132453 [Mycena crocata]|nr:hypothetical protein C8R43DRAFT_1132453 [Mycena crocata]